MSIVGKIVDKTQFTEEIDGLPFILRLITAEQAAVVIGNKMLGLMRAGTTSKDLPQEETIRITKGYLKACMVSPKFDETTDAESDQICLDDLGEYANKVLSIVFERSGFDQLGKSNGSSEDTEGGS